jgi:hypothetical protein
VTEAFVREALKRAHYEILADDGTLNLPLPKVAGITR